MPADPASHSPVPTTEPALNHSQRGPSWLGPKRYSTVMLISPAAAITSERECRAEQRGQAARFFFFVDDIERDDDPQYAAHGDIHGHEDTDDHAESKLQPGTTNDALQGTAQRGDHTVWRDRRQ